MYQEPCCISRKLPPLLKKQPFTFFQTNGDVTVSKLLEAVSYLAGINQLVFVLVVPQVDVFLLRELYFYFARGWYGGLLLLTAEDQAKLVRNELAGVLDKVAYGCHPQVKEGAMAVVGEKMSVYLQGRMPLTIDDHSLCTYTAYLGNDGQVLRSAMEAYFPKIRLSHLIEPTDKRVAEVLNYHF